MSGTVNVNRPVNKKEKEADVNRKLQLYGIFSAFQSGKVPSNEQIDVALNSFLASKALTSPSNELSAEGKVLVQDVREVVNQAKLMLLSKNEGNLLQDFIWQTTQFDAQSVTGPNAPVDKETAKQHGNDALEGLRTLGTLLITNGQFRKLLQDATILLRDMAGDAAANSGNLVRPSDDQLQQMDRAAEDNTWHDKPDFSKENLKAQAKKTYSKKNNDADPEGTKDALVADTANAVDQTRASAQAADSNAEAASNVQDTAVAQKKKFSDRLDPAAKEKLAQKNEEYRRKAREYLKKKMPQERKDQTIWRLKKMVIECQQHPDYTEAVQTLLNLAETYGRHGKAMGTDSAGSAKQARTGMEAAELDLRTLIERFANGTSTADLWDSIHQIYVDADKDEDLKQWFKNMDSYIRRCLLEQGYVVEDASTEEWNRLYDKGHYLLREKYRSHTDRVVDEVKFVADQFDQDPQNKAFALACQKLFTDLGNDENGKPTFKPHLLKDLTEVIIPGILTSTAYIPIPRIEFSDATADAVIENLVLESDNFTPNVAEIASEHYFRWGRKRIANKNKNSIEVKLGGVQLDLRDVSYHVKKKQGFPSLTDTGIANILLPGDGFTMKIKMSTADKMDTQKFFKIDRVDVDIKHLKLKVIQSKYKTLFNLFNPLALRVLRPVLQKAVEKAIKDQCDRLDTYMYEIKKEADRAKAEAVESPDQIPNMYQRYYNAAQKRALQGKEKAKKAQEQAKKVNVAMTQEDSMLPNVKLPGGISSKATEYKQLARKGEKWESPVFSIGAASKSTDIPAAPTIVRKPHAVNGAKAALNGKTATNGIDGPLAVNNTTVPVV